MYISSFFVNFAATKRKIRVMKKKAKYVFILISISLMIMSCGGKKDSLNIITQKPKKNISQKIQEVGDYAQSRNIKCCATSYKIEVKRMADPSLPTVIDDATGSKYYDNKISIHILRKDGSEYFLRTFTKSDFDTYIDDSYKKRGVLLGIVFDHTEDECLYFAASVGVPDKMSDEYVPLVMKITKAKQVNISKDTQMDTGSEDELEKSEEDGM